MLTQRKTAIFDNRDIVFMLLFLIGSIAAVNFSFFGGFNLGFTISYLFFAILSLFYISFQTFRYTGFSLFCLLCAVLLALSFGLHANMLMKWISFCAIIVLTAIFLSLSMGTVKYGADSYLFFVDLLKTVFVVPTVFIGETVESFLQKCRKKKDKKYGFGVVVGVLLAIPVLLIIVPLLASADDAFRGFLSYVAVDFSGEGIISLVFGFVLFLFLFSMAFAYRKGLTRNEVTQRTGVLEKRHDANPAMINTFLALISFVYVVYLFSQLAYFVNAFSGILPENYSLSEYARSGFFEMAFLCAVNFLLLFITLFFTKYKNGKRLLSTRLLATFICVFSLFLCCSVFAKLCMYIDRYGMTPLRIYTMLFTLFLTLLLLLTIVRLYVVRIPYIKIAAVSAAVLCVATAFGNIDGVIARYNESTYRSGSIEELDVALLGDLSDAAVPVLVRLLDENDQNLAQSAAEVLAQKAEKYFVMQDNNFINEREDEDFRSYNRVRQQTKALILDNWGKIQELLV